MQAAPRCRTLEDWFTRKPGNKEWFESLKNTGSLVLNDEYLQIKRTQFRRRILERVETGVGKRDLDILSLIDLRYSCWEDGDQAGQEKYKQKILAEAKNCMFQYDQIMNMSLKEEYHLIRSREIRSLLDVFPKEPLPYREKEEIYENFFNFFTMVFGVHEFPSEISKSIFHLKRFTFYWLFQISQEKREALKLDQEGEELVLFHNNFNEIDFGITKKDKLGIGILTREV